MLRLRISPQALLDLEEIFEYTVLTWNFSQAEKYQNHLHLKFQDLVANPNLGIDYSHKKGNYKRVIANRHLIFYTVDETCCNIIRILHERMDLNENL